MKQKPANSRPISTARSIRDAVIAELKMPSGETFFAIWEERGRRTAWWPLSGRRSNPVGLYDPVSWRRIRSTDDWVQA